MTDPRPTDTPNAAALPVLDRIDATHDQMRHWLGELQILVNHMDAQGWDAGARDHARAVIDFFANTARQHHLEVDRQVFALIAGRGDKAVDDSVEQFRHDHGWLEESWHELHAQLQPVAEGFGGYDVDVLRHSADVYAQLLLDHLAREKEFVAPAARASADRQPRSAELRRAARPELRA